MFSSEADCCCVRKSNLMGMYGLTNFIMVSVDLFNNHLPLKLSTCVVEIHYSTFPIGVSCLDLF